MEEKNTQPIQEDSLAPNFYYMIVYTNPDKKYVHVKIVDSDKDLYIKRDELVEQVGALISQKVAMALDSKLNFLGDMYLIDRINETIKELRPSVDLNRFYKSLNMQAAAMAAKESSQQRDQEFIPSFLKSPLEIFRFH